MLYAHTSRTITRHGCLTCFSQPEFVPVQTFRQSKSVLSDVHRRVN